MTEEVKDTRAKKPAKKEMSPGIPALRKVMDGVYEQAREAKKRGEPVGWFSSKFPCELAEAFDLKVIYPKNQTTGIATNRDDKMLCQAAEDMGYDNDIYGYTRINLAYAEGFHAGRRFDPATGESIINPTSSKPLRDENGNVVTDPKTGKPKKDPKTRIPCEELVSINEIRALPDGPKKEMHLKALRPIRQNLMPMPDFVLCCNNICNCMTKWCEDIARIHSIPLVMIDTPYNNDVEIGNSKVRYIRAQFDATIKQLERISGKKFDEKRLEQVCTSANHSATAWLRVCDYLQCKPAPMSGFDLFNHMADIVTACGKVETAEAFEQLARDLEKDVKRGTTAFPFPEKKRIMFEGVPCWPRLPQFFKPLKENGTSVTVVVYAPTFDFICKDMNGMAGACYKAPSSVCIKQGVAWREGICRDNKTNDVLVHYNCSRKPWSGYMVEMRRRFTKDLGVPTTDFGGDQVDPRNFNATQYETRIQGLVEAMETNEKNNETKEA